MKKIGGILLAIFVAVGFISTSAFADPVKGQKYYLKFMKDPVGMSGAKFAVQHTQEEWKKLFDGDAAEFIKVYSEKYPNVAEFLKGDKFKKLMPHIKDFFIKYASDSGNIPSC